MAAPVVWQPRQLQRRTTEDSVAQRIKHHFQDYDTADVFMVEDETGHNLWERIRRDVHDRRNEWFSNNLGATYYRVLRERWDGFRKEQLGHAANWAGNAVDGGAANGAGNAVDGGDDVVLTVSSDDEPPPPAAPSTPSTS